MDDNISIKIEKDNSYSRCVVNSPVLTSSYKALQNAIDEIIKEKNRSSRCFVVDFYQATMISSAFIDVFNSLKEQIPVNKCDLVIISPKEDIGELFELTGVSRIYPKHESMEEFLPNK